MPESAHQRKPSSAWWGRLRLPAFSVLAGLVLWEVGLNVLFLERHLWLSSVEAMIDDDGEAIFRESEFLYADKSAAREMWREFSASERKGHVSHVMYRRIAFKGRYINIGEDRNRKTWEPGADGSRPERMVWVFGGSTVWGTGAEDDSATIPSLMALRLAEIEPSVRWRVVNFGESGFASTTEYVQLALALRNAVPDAVVFVDGVNDVQNAIHNGDPTLGANFWANKYILENKRDPDESLIKTVYILRRLGILPTKRAQMVGLQLGDSTLIRVSVGTMKKSWAAAASLCRAYSVTFLAVLQPSAVSGEYGVAHGGKLMNTSFGRAMRGAHAMIASDPPREFPFLDLSGILPVHERVFFDYCHTGRRGNTPIAVAIADVLSSSMMPE